MADEKQLKDKDLSKISGGTNKKMGETVWTWFRCFRPGCHYECRLLGQIPEGELRVCPECHQDSFKSTGRFEVEEDN